MQIGSIELRNNIILAPMAGVTDLAFRILAKEMGAGLVYTEMVSDKGLIYNNVHTIELLKIEEIERPVAVQIFGSDALSMAAAAKKVEAYGADIIDINMGCPTPKIVKNGEGAALMRNPELAYKIMVSVVDSVTRPVTVKIRKGWDDSSVNAVQIAKLAEKAGIQAVAVHGRTKEQYYTGNADWEIISAVKCAVSIPVIGNGDIKTCKDAKKMLEETNCDAVMIGRGAQGNPWLIRQIVHFLTTGEKLEPPAMNEKLEMLARHLEMLINYKGEYIGIREMRKHAAWYIKGLPHAAEIRAAFNSASTKEEFNTIIKKLKEYSKQEG